MLTRGVDTEARLSELVAEIIDNSERAASAARLSVQFVIRCGECLLAARELVDHGDWQEWVEQNCPFRYHTAVNYMRLARHSDMVLEFGKEIGVTAALRMVMEATKTRSNVYADPTMLAEAKGLQSVGMKYADIGRHMGISGSSAYRLLNPEARKAAEDRRKRARELERNALKRDAAERARREIAARNGKGGIGGCYQRIRQTLLAFDRACPKYKGDTRSKMDAAYALIMQAEDLIGEALRCDFSDNETRSRGIEEP